MGLGIVQNVEDAGAPHFVMGVVGPWKYATRHVCHRAKFGRSGSNDTSVRSDMRRKIWSLRVPPIRVTQCHRN